MNLLFLQPKAKDIAAIAPGICYVAAATEKAGHEVFGINLNNVQSTQYEKVLSTIVLNKKIDVVFIGGTSGDFCEVERITQLIKCISKRLVVVLGGYLVSTEPELVINNIPADFGVIGPGEATSIELLEMLSHTSEKIKFKKIPGLIFLSEKLQTIKTEERKIKEFDFSIIPRIDLLFEEYIKENKHICLVSSIGCPFRCTFCSRPVGTRKYEQRTLDSLFEEIEYWLSRYDIKDVNINDELFANNSDRVLEFCSRIKKYKIGFSFQGRVDTVTENLLPILKDAGCHTISYGLESANNKILSSMKKGITISQIMKTLSATRAHGISIVGNFIFGDIAETYETACETLDWWLKYVSKFDIHLTMIQPFPGSYVYRYAVDKGIIQDKLKFLKNGCPAVNFSMMSDDEMFRLKRRIDTLLQIKSRVTDAKITAVDENNCYNLILKCGHCNKGFEVLEKDLRVDSRWVFNRCPHCGGHNLLTPNDLFKPFLYQQVLDDVAENLFYNFVLDKKRIAIWGAKDRGQLLIASSSNLRKCIVKVVDSAYQTFKEKLYGEYEVDAPETLKNIKIDCLIITSTNYRDEIRNIVENEMKLKVDIMNL